MPAPALGRQLHVPAGIGERGLEHLQGGRGGADPLGRRLRLVPGAHPILEVRFEQVEIELLIGVLEHGQASGELGELPDIEGPVVEEEGLGDLGREAPRGTRRLLVAQEVIEQQEDVGASLGERGEVEDPVAQAGLEIGAEGADVAVGGGDDGEVDRSWLAAAERRDRAVLEDAEQLGLQRLGELADLVEEQGAAR